MNEITEIFVELLHEGMPLWRPAIAQRNDDGTYVIWEQEIPEDEQWKFLPCEVVMVESQVRYGRLVIVAVDWATPNNLENEM
jgi:hypothetical protein